MRKCVKSWESMIKCAKVEKVWERTWESVLKVEKVWESVLKVEKVWESVLKVEKVWESVRKFA